MAIFHFYHPNIFIIYKIHSFKVHKPPKFQGAECYSSVNGFPFYLVVMWYSPHLLKVF